MTTSINPISQVQEIVDSFDRGNYSRVEELLDKAKSGSPGIAGGSFIPDSREQRQATIDSAFPYLHDLGAGIISQGLESLEVMSKVIKGASYSAFRMFDRTVIAFSPDEMKTADQRKARMILATNLRMDGFIDIASISSPAEVAKLYAIFDKMTRKIKSGSFRRTDFQNEVLIACKSVVRAALNYKKVL